MRKSKLLRLLAVLFTLALVAAACGDDDDNGAADDSASDDSADDGGDPPVDDGTEYGVDRDAGTITIGVITPLTGDVAAIGVPLSTGAQAYWEKVNDEGGIGGELQVVLNTQDNQYSQAATTEAYNRIKDEVALFGQILGTPPTQAVLPQLARDGILAAPASLDAEWVAEEYLIPVGGPYQVQSANGLHWWAEEMSEGDDVYCAMIQDDAYGNAGLEGFEDAAEALDIDIAAVARYSLGTQDVTAQIGDLTSEGCTVNLLVSVPSDTSTIFASAAGAQYFPTWLGQSPSYITAFKDSALAPYLSATYYQLSEGTEWGDTSVPGMAEMLEVHAEYAEDQTPDIYFVFGYYQASVIHRILEAAHEAGDLSRSGLKAAFEGLGTVSFGGLTGDYTYGAVEDRNPPRSTVIYSFDAEKDVGLAKEAEITSSTAEAYDFTG